MDRRWRLIAGVCLIATGSHATYSFGDGALYWIDVTVRLIFAALPGAYLLYTYKQATKGDETCERRGHYAGPS